MKKILLILLLAAMITPVFAEDAKVLPQGVGRFYMVPGYAWAAESFDKDGAREDTDDVKLANLAMALEYGVLPWMSVGLKWIPGWVYYGTVENQDDARITDVSDFELGFKTQIVGPEAPVQSDIVRFVVTPGLLIPTPGPDWATEYENAAKGDEFVAEGAANHALGFGAQTAVDYVVNDNFFISLFGEGRFYLSKEFEKVNLTTAGTTAGINDTIANFEFPTGTPPLSGNKIENISYNDPADDPTNLGFDLNIEFSPHYETELTDGVRFGASLPVDYTYTPGLNMVNAYSGDADFSKATMPDFGDQTLSDLGLSDAEIASFEENTNQQLEDSVEAALEDTDSYLWKITPGVSVFFTAIPVPIEVTLDYAIPLAGKNTTAQNSISSQIRFYFAF